LQKTIVVEKEIGNFLVVLIAYPFGESTPIRCGRYHEQVWISSLLS